jgi:NAD-dependent dihydropyrimidine dehydrogenase PreA subunit
MKNKGPFINIELCTGCGACVDVCCKNLYEVIKGKAVVKSPDDCCGTGEKCLPACPAGAISFPSGLKQKCSCSCGCSDSGCC